MNNQELMAKLAALPEPDFMHAGKLSDPLGSCTSYKAATVVQLIERAVAAERERCAKLCEETGAYTDELEMALMCAAAIRGA